MFWHSAANSNAIDNLLDQPNVKLTTILDQDEVLMEIRGMNKKLIEFLTRHENMGEMLDLITTVPSSDIPIPLQYKFPNTACEVLTSDISFAEKIAAEPTMMMKLFHFFRDAEPPLNPLLASYVCRVLGEVIVRKLDQNWYSYQLNLIQVMGFLQSEPNLLDWLMKHLETSAVCDFLHKLVMNVEGQDMRASLYEWLETKEQFIMKLVNSMDARHNREAHVNVSRLVGDLLFALQDETSSSSQDRSMDSEPFLLALKSHAVFERLLDVVFGDDTRSQSSIVYGLEMLLALLGIAKKPTKPNSKVDTMFESNQDVLIPGPLKVTLLSRLEILMRFLSPSSTSEPIHLPNGILKEPLGIERLAIVKFVAHTITLHDVALNEALIQHGILRKVLLFQEYALLDKIMDVFNSPDLKVGFMGHLAKMTAVIMDNCESNETVKTVLNELQVQDKFKEFYDEKWKEYQAKSTQLLAGAPLPSSGVTMATNNHNYESDPGVTWDSSSGTGMAADGEHTDNDNYFEGASGEAFGVSDRYDDEKSKAIFEMFCTDRTSNGDDEDEDNSYGGLSMTYGNAQAEGGEDFEWSNPNMFFKQLEENNELFGQLGINGSSGNTEGASGPPHLLIANPWAGQESVQVDTSSPWAAFDFQSASTDNSAEESTQAGSNSDNWAKFDQSFPSGADNSNFADFSNAPDIFSTAAEPALLTANTTASSVTDHASSTSQEESKEPGQL